MLQASMGRDRMLGFIKRLVNAKMFRSFEFWRDRCNNVIERERIAASETIRRAWRDHRARKILKQSSIVTQLIITNYILRNSVRLF